MAQTEGNVMTLQDVPDERKTFVSWIKRSALDAAPLLRRSIRSISYPTVNLGIGTGLNLEKFPYQPLPRYRSLVDDVRQRLYQFPARDSYVG